MEPLVLELGCCFAPHSADPSGKARGVPGAG